MAYRTLYYLRDRAQHWSRTKNLNMLPVLIPPLWVLPLEFGNTVSEHLVFGAENWNDEPNRW